jgi:hypothetical protein
VSPSKTVANAKPLVPGPDGKYFCPECNVGPYNTAKGLSTHRRVVHKIAGTASSTLSERKRKAAELAKANQAPTSNDSSSGNKKDRREEKREYRERKKKEALAAVALPAPVPLAEHEPKSKASATKETKKNAHQLGKKRGPYKSRPAAQAADRKELSTTAPEVQGPPQGPVYYDPRNPPRIPEATLLVAFGRFLEFSAGIAREYDLPQRQFTEELIASIRRST